MTSSAGQVTVRPTTRGVPTEVVAALPASKSHVQRALLLAGLPAMAASGCRSARSFEGVHGLDPTAASQDIAVTIRVLRTLGAEIERADDESGSIHITKSAERPPPTSPAVTLDCHENGTCSRMVGAALAVLGWPEFVLDGAPPLRRRPMQALADCAEALGADVWAADGGRLPLRVRSRATGSPVESLEVDGSTTTQVASGVLLGMALRGGPARLRVRNPRAEAYLHITTAVIEGVLGRGVDVENVADDCMVFRLLDADPRRAVADPWRAPPDASSAAFPCVLAALLGQGVPCRFAIGRADGDDHPDWGALEHVRTITRAPRHEPLVLDELGRCPDAVPALAVLAAGLDRAPVSLRGAPSLRHKESDRIAAMRGALIAFGADVRERDDGLDIVGGIDRARSLDRELVVEGLPADHRVVMATALLAAVPAIVGRGRVRLLVDPAAVQKSWPGFWAWLRGYAEVE